MLFVRVKPQEWEDLKALFKRRRGWCGSQELSRTNKVNNNQFLSDEHVGEGAHTLLRMRKEALNTFTHIWTPSYRLVYSYSFCVFFFFFSVCNCVCVCVCVCVCEHSLTQTHSVVTHPNVGPCLFLRSDSLFFPPSLSVFLSAPLLSHDYSCGFEWPCSVLTGRVKCIMWKPHKPNTTSSSSSTDCSLATPSEKYVAFPHTHTHAHIHPPLRAPTSKKSALHGRPLWHFMYNKCVRADANQESWYFRLFVQCQGLLVAEAEWCQGDGLQLLSLLLYPSIHSRCLKA